MEVKRNRSSTCLPETGHLYDTFEASARAVLHVVGGRGACHRGPSSSLPYPSVAERGRQPLPSEGRTVVELVEEGGCEALDSSRPPPSSFHRLSVESSHGGPRGTCGAATTFSDRVGGAAMMRTPGLGVMRGARSTKTQRQRALRELASPASALRISSEPGQAVCVATICVPPTGADPDVGRLRTGAEEAMQEPRQLKGRLGGDGPSNLRQTTKRLERAPIASAGHLGPLRPPRHHDGGRAHGPWMRAGR